jgi:hypothetical protein
LRNLDKCKISQNQLLNFRTIIRFQKWNFSIYKSESVFLIEFKNKLLPNLHVDGYNHKHIWFNVVS